MSVQHYMNRDEILEAIKELAQSQGFYSKVYQIVIGLSESNYDVYDALMCGLESANLKDKVDLVMYLES